MIKRILFLDLDGVLVDFVSAAIKVIKSKHLTELDITSYGTIETITGTTRNEFWRRIKAEGEDFWSTAIQPYPWFEELLSFAEASADCVYLSTSPSLNPKCLSGKAKWISKNIPRYSQKTMFGSKKFLLAGPGRALLDDKVENIEEFNASGGTGILFPQPWNSTRKLCIPQQYRFEQAVLKIREWSCSFSP